VEEDTVEDGVGSTAEESAERDQHAAREADHALVMAAARRIIASDAAIIHRLGTV
jgi:hypothetical protein